MTNSLDLFDGLDTSDSQGAPVGSVGNGAPDSATTEIDNSTSGSTESADAESSPVETVAQIPDGVMSVTEFAAFMTQTLMKAKFEAGEDLDMSEYVVPQAVYQTVKAQKDRIPHVLVKGPDDAEARVYILKAEATAWWIERKDRLSTRGQGAARASSRTPEDNLSLLGAAVEKSLYAQARQAMWVERTEQAAKLVEKYKQFLSDAKIEEATVELAIQEATTRYHAEQAAKEAEKAKNTKKGKSAQTDED